MLRTSGFVDDVIFSHNGLMVRHIPKRQYTVSQKNVLTLKRYSSKLQGAILIKFGRNIQNTLE